MPDCQVSHAHSLLKDFIRQHFIDTWWDTPSCWLYSRKGSSKLIKEPLCTSPSAEPQLKDNLGSGLALQEDTYHIDWASLLAMRKVVKPKFQMPHLKEKEADIQSCNLRIEMQEDVAIGHQTGKHSQRGTHATESNLFGVAHENPYDIHLICQAHDSQVVFPRHSRFVMSDISSLAAQASCLAGDEGFKLIVLDPPWENKSVHRKGHYQTLPNWELLDLPMSTLMDKVC